MADLPFNPDDDADIPKFLDWGRALPGCEGVEFQQWIEEMSAVQDNDELSMKVQNRMAGEALVLMGYATKEIAPVTNGRHEMQITFTQQGLDRVMEVARVELVRAWKRRNGLRVVGPA